MYRKDGKMSFLDGLNPQQLQAVQDTEGVMLVLAFLRLRLRTKLPVR